MVKTAWKAQKPQRGWLNRRGIRLPTKIFVRGRSNGPFLARSLIISQPGVPRRSKWLLLVPFWIISPRGPSRLFKWSILVSFWIISPTRAAQTVQTVAFWNHFGPFRHLGRPDGPMTVQIVAFGRILNNFATWAAQWLKTVKRRASGRPV